MNNVSKFRKIVKDDGRISQRDLLIEFMRSREFKEEDKPTSNVPIDSQKVPHLVSSKQFVAITFRRQVRHEIECARLLAGRPIDGRRTGKYKYFQKHIHARRRVRDSNGLFVQTRLKDDDLGVASLCNN